MLNYFNFKKFNDKYLLTNDFGRYIFLEKNNLANLIIGKLSVSDKDYKSLIDNFFMYDCSKQAFTEYTKDYMRNSKNYLFQSTSLHIFVVTTACNMSCKYCQAQNGYSQPNGIMSFEIAEKSVDIALSSPSKYLTFEFQGGEPLLNFKTIKHIVEYTESKNYDKVIDFNIVSNLTLLNEKILLFLQEHHVNISTSLDGNKETHNFNRLYKNGENTYKDVLKSIKKIKTSGLNIGAIQTTTKYSLNNYKEIIDAYLDLGFDNIFIRPLTPLGCANKNWNEIGYNPDEFVNFYKDCITYILKKNKSGYFLKEGHASIFLSKILSGYPVNYMELRSPCGAALGQMAYNYDGNVFTCDEGRMLAEMGNNAFKLGDVFENSYDDLLNSSICKITCKSSIIESLPGCCDCVYQPYCGVCPVVNFACNKDIYSRLVKDYRCKINTGILDSIFEILYNNNEEDVKILRSWL